MAIIKIINESGKYKDSKAIGDVVHYAVSKAGKDGVFGGTVQPDIAVVSMEAVARVYHRESGTHLRHSILSFTPNECVTPRQVKDIAQQALTYYQDDYQILAAVHEDKDHLHIHFVMNSVNYRDGSKYRGKKKDYYGFLKHVNEVLHPYGLHAWIAKK